MMKWTAYTMHGNEKGPISFSHIGDFPTKRGAMDAIRSAQGGKWSPIVRVDHTYLTFPARKS